jgi:adenosine deaminase
MDYGEFLARVPKAELHVHLVGALRPATLAALARKHGLALPRPPDELYRYRDFFDFIAVFRLASRVLVDADDFARAVYEYVADGHRLGNLRHLELFFNPTYSYQHGTRYRTQLDGLIAGIGAARADFGVSCLLIPSIDREFSAAAALEMVEDVIAYRRDEVVGIGMDGPENKGPPAQFAAAYRRAAEAGLRRTAHVCEDYAPTPPENYAVCRDLLGCERLDHGYRLLGDDALVARARSEDVAFTCCPKPSTRERDATRLAAIGAMVEAGLRVTLATDDPLMFETDLADAYRRVFLGQAWGPARVREILLAGVEASWLDPAGKVELRREFERELDVLWPQLDPRTVPSKPAA